MISRCSMRIRSPEEILFLPRCSRVFELCQIDGGLVQGRLVKVNLSSVDSFNALVSAFDEGLVGSKPQFRVAFSAGLSVPCRCEDHWWISQQIGCFMLP